MDDVDSELLQLARVADAGELQQLGRVDRAATEDHLARLDPLRADPPGDLDADGPRAVEENAIHERAAAHLEVLPVPDRVQVGPRGAESAAAVDVAVEGGEALLPVAVDVVGERVAGLLHRLEEGLEERALGRAALEHERAVAAAPVVGARETALHPLEVGQAVGVVPLLHPGVGGPALVVERVAALEDHPVDARGAAEDLAARVVDAAPVHERLRLGLVLPVVEAVPDRRRQPAGMWMKTSHL